MQRVVSLSLCGSFIMLFSFAGCGAQPEEEASLTVASESLELEMDMDSDEESDDASCAERCAAHARQVYKTCKEGGGSDEECRARAAHALRACAERCRPECGDRCRAIARRAFRECVEGGGGVRECRARAIELFRRCIRECRDDGRPETRPAPGPEVFACVGKCREEARAQYKTCVDGGATREECVRKVLEGFRACVRRCIGRPDAAAL